MTCICECVCVCDDDDACTCKIESLYLTCQSILITEEKITGIRRLRNGLTDMSGSRCGIIMKTQ